MRRVRWELGADGGGRRLLKGHWSRSMVWGDEVFGGASEIHQGIVNDE